MNDLVSLCRELTTEERQETQEKAKNEIRNLFAFACNLWEDVDALKKILNTVTEARRIIEPYKTSGQNDLYFALSKLVECLETNDLYSLRNTLRILNVVW